MRSKGWLVVAFATYVMWALALIAAEERRVQGDWPMMAIDLALGVPWVIAGNLIILRWFLMRLRDG